MANLTLVIGNKNYSSWSLRPWFLLTALDIPFTEVRGFSAADAMFAPVSFRFATYGVDGDETVSAYSRTVLGHPAMQRWAADAAAEAEVLAASETGAA